MKIFKFLPFLLLLVLTQSIAQTTINIVPKPNHIEIGEGTFTFNPKTALIISLENRAIGEVLQEKLGFKLKTKKKANINYAAFKIDTNQVKNSEGYQLTANKNGVTITAASQRGLFYGLQSLLQLLPSEVEKKGAKNAKAWAIPVVSITDAPQFKWRGMHLDVCRHFYSVDFIKKQLDLMALFKLNTFHWHLTEDQGWRIEIKKYPKLTSIGSKRIDEGKEYGGYYTQEQIKEVVNYAANLHIDVVPEIELPGHSLAAITAYPQLGCTGGPYTIRNIWGIEPDIYCAGNDEVFTFIEDVLEEVIALFPYQYFHIGGDEAPKTRWETCPKCQKRMKDEGLHNEHELQSYFIKRAESILEKHHKKLIGWDEILEGGLAKSAAVMSWRGEEGGIKAANMGHDVVMTPGNFVYLDHFQGDSTVEPVGIGGYTTLEESYNYNPIPKEIEPSKAHHVLGTQGNVWTEYMYTGDDVEYRVWPRLMAIAEVAWTAPENKDFDDFVTRLDNNQFKRLDYHGVNYHIPLAEGTPNYVAFIHKAVVSFSTTRPVDIHYTSDGSEPNLESAKYTEPLIFNKNTTLKVRTALKNGEMSTVRTISIEQQTPIKAVQATTQKTIKFKYQEGTFYNVTDLNNSLNWEGKEAPTMLDAMKYGDIKTPSAKIFEGYIKVLETGVYEFSTDLNQLYIAGKLIVDNGKNVKRFSNRTTSIALEAGLHPIKMVQLNNIEGGWPQLWNAGKIRFKTPSSNTLKLVPQRRFLSSK